MDLEPDTPESHEPIIELKCRLLNISLAPVFGSTQISIVYVSPVISFSLVLGIELSNSHVLGKCPTAELYAQTGASQLCPS